MGKFKIPAPDAPAEDWGRLAVSIPGWRWMPGMRCRQRTDRGSLEPWEAAGVDGAHRRYMGGELRKHWSVFRPSPRRGTWHAVGSYGGGHWHWPDPDDSATEGCLLRLLGGPVRHRFEATWRVQPQWMTADRVTVSQNATSGAWEILAHATAGTMIVGSRLAEHHRLGRACIAAAAAIGEWPGGAE